MVKKRKTTEDEVYKIARGVFYEELGRTILTILTIGGIITIGIMIGIGL